VPVEVAGGDTPAPRRAPRKAPPAPPKRGQGELF